MKTTCEECEKISGSFCQGCLKKMSGLTEKQFLEQKIKGLQNRLADIERRGKHPNYRCVYGQEGRCIYCGGDDQWTITQIIAKSGEPLFMIRKGKIEHWVKFDDPTNPTRCELFKRKYDPPRNN